jgi:hypothetical protein
MKDRSPSAGSGAVGASRAAPATGTVRLHRFLEAPPERVYKAFLDPDAMAKWPPLHGFTGRVHRMDARVPTPRGAGARAEAGAPVPHAVDAAPRAGRRPGRNPLPRIGARP